ncbi:IPT/TIG domain-containing protein [Flavobacterium sp.]|uniref:IPT/TIG domain-containing protein n=1 Tax=Flavobacterium sp. TaxID=239 RepID=UPI00375047C4
MKTFKIILLFIATIVASCSKDDTPELPPPPTSNLSISSINPTSGPKNTTVIVTGVNFSSNNTSNIVSLNGKPCTVNAASATSLTITIPRGAGSGVIKLTVAGVTVQTPNFEYMVTPSAVSTVAGSTRGFADGIGSNVLFNLPFGTTVDAVGNLYVADGDNHKIRKISPVGVVTTLAGSTFGFADGSNITAQFYAPTGVATDASGNIYVTDSANHKIRKISPTGVVSTLAGSTVGFADGNGNNAKFDYPRDLVLDNQGNVYVADYNNSRIRKISPTGVVSTFAGSTNGFSDGIGSSALFKNPRGLTIDLSGNLYVADQNNHKIRKITAAGVVTTIAGSISGFADGEGSTAKFSFPSGIAVDDLGNIYVSDTFNHKIRKISPSGIVSTFAGSTAGYVDGVTNTAKFLTPGGIAIDALGTVYVADTDNNKIRKITQD